MGGFGKRGQITLFIIIGLMILIGTVTFLYVKKISSETLKVDKLRK